MCQEKKFLASTIRQGKHKVQISIIKYWFRALSGVKKKVASKRNIQKVFASNDLQRKFDDWDATLQASVANFVGYKWVTAEDGLG